MERYKRIVGLLKIIFYKIIYRKRLKIKLDIICHQSLIIRCLNNGSIYLGRRVQIRDNVILNSSSQGRLVIKDNVFINDGCKLNCRKLLLIGKGTIIGQNVLFYDHDHDYKTGIQEKNQSFITSEIIIGENVWIGSGAIILKGVHIGDNSVVAAGTIVTRDIKENTLVISKQDLEKRELKYE